MKARPFRGPGWEFSALASCQIYRMLGCLHYMGKNNTLIIVDNISFAGVTRAAIGPDCKSGGS